LAGKLTENNGMYTISCKAFIILQRKFREEDLEIVIKRIYYNSILTTAFPITTVFMPLFIESPAVSNTTASPPGCICDGTKS